MVVKLPHPSRPHLPNTLQSDDFSLWMTVTNVCIVVAVATDLQEIVVAAGGARAMMVPRSEQIEMVRIPMRMIRAKDMTLRWMSWNKQMIGKIFVVLEKLAIVLEVPRVWSSNAWWK